MDASLADIEVVYRSRGADFLRLALARTGEVESARDAVQEGFAHAIRARSSYRGTGPLEAWVARCVMNAAHDAARRARRSVARTLADAAAGETGAAAPASSPDADTEAVRDAVRRLPQRQRDALFLRFYLGFDYAAIAETLGIEVGTVSATLHAARAALADTLEEVAG
jgi:RNA polymerase sigma factor (sigma-70 family)